MNGGVRAYGWLKGGRPRAFGPGMASGAACPNISQRALHHEGWNAPRRNSVCTTRLHFSSRTRKWILLP